MSQPKRIRPYLFLSLPFAVFVFLIASTSTVYTLGSLPIYLLTLVIIIIVSFITDAKMQTNFKHIAITLFTVSLISTILGICTHPYQERQNFERAKKFIAELEHYKSVHGHYPKDTEIKIPSARNGLYVSEFEYFPYTEKNTYTINYFDGFWNTKVYHEDTNTWYTDD